MGGGRATHTDEEEKRERYNNYHREWQMDEITSVMKFSVVTQQLGLMGTTNPIRYLYLQNVNRVIGREREKVAHHYSPLHIDL